jgi:cytidylate kinase
VHFDLAFLDTGRFYRAVGHAVLQAGDDPNDPAAAVAAVRALDPANVDTGDLYTERVAKAASVVAAMPNVRKDLLVFQRTFAHEPPDGKSGAVLDGRDIASVVCPDATYKFFVTASAAERATRRFKELQENGVESTYAAVLADIEQRDQRDRTRKVSPLKVADARVIDTSDKTPDAVFEEALAHIEGEQST